MCRVLIIEDEVLMATDLQGCLQALGATSFAFAETESEAVEQARLWRPELITSDVRLRIGTGPRAVEIIQREMGPVPVIFITATPEDCMPCEHPARVLAKPMHEPTFAAAFRALAPI